MNSKKIGRPTSNPKNERLTVRLDAESVEILDEYSKKEKITKNETIRRGIKKLKEDIKK